jgi:hypothetical protein
MPSLNHMTDLMHYAFIDESGTASVPGGTHFLVVAILSTKYPREIEMPVRRALKKFGPNLARGEIKAADFEERAVARFLKEIVKQNVSILALIVDQGVILQPPKEMEDIYRRTVALSIYRLVERWQYLDICLDQRYTNKRHRFLLEKQIREAIQDLPQKVILIHQESSVNRKKLQAVDAVSWAFFQKYERSNSYFYDIIASKVVLEEVIYAQDWSSQIENKKAAHPGP